VINRKTAIVTAVIVLLVGGALLAVWLGGGDGDSGTTTLELTSS